MVGVGGIEVEVRLEFDVVVAIVGYRMIVCV
jgi:hypothetical protein